MARGTILLAALLLIACNERRPHSPPEYVMTCRPGGSSRDCYWRLKRAPTNMFPAGRLEGIEFRTELLAAPGQNHVTQGVSTQHATFVHIMKFNVGRDDVMELLVEELGEPLKRGKPPLRTTRLIEGDVWETEEGFWVCAEKALVWYSQPVSTNEQRGLPAEPASDLDRYVRPVPKSAVLWKKVGNLLIGVDRGPRPST